jgi:hypothetical protein
MDVQNIRLCVLQDDFHVLACGMTIEHWHWIHCSSVWCKTSQPLFQVVHRLHHS